MKQIYENYFITETGEIYNKYNKQIKPVDNGKGYLIVGLTVENKRIIKAVHRLLAEAFISNPNNFSDVNHIDGDRRNNSLKNLEWLTHGDNIKHSYLLKNRSALGENNANCKTTEETVRLICNYLEQGYKPSKIRDLGFNYTLVRSIKRRRNWINISKDFNF